MTMTTELPIPTDPAGTALRTPQDHEVHVVIDGDLTRPPVVFVHGIPGTVRDARYLGPALVDAGVCCVRIDMPGFGTTPVAAFPRAESKHRAAFVRGVMHGLGVPRFAIAGHSIGGAVALACAALFPDDVTAAVFINSVGVRRHHGLVVPTTAHRTLARAARLPVVGDVLAGQLDRYYAGRGTRADRPVDGATMAHHLAIVADLDFAAQRRRARAVRCPTLVVSSEDDRLVEPAVGFSLARALTSSPRVTHRHVSGGGHMLQKYEARAIAGWLAATLVR